MGNWFKVRWAAFADAVGLRRYAIEGAIALIINAVNIYLAQTGGSNISASMAWVLSVTTVFILFFWWTLNYAVTLRYDLEPKFSVAFDPAHGGVVESPIRHPNTPDIVDYGKFVKLEVSCITKKSIKRCVASITKIEMRTGLDKTTIIWNDDALALNWARTHSEVVEINATEKRYVDILEVVGASGVVSLSTQVPLRIHSAMRRAGVLFLRSM